MTDERVSTSILDEPGFMLPLAYCQYIVPVLSTGARDLLHYMAFRLLSAPNREQMLSRGITQNEILYGEVDEDGKVQFPGVGLSRNTLTRLLPELKELNVVRPAEVTGNTVRWTLNLDKRTWNWDRINLALDQLQAANARMRVKRIAVGRRDHQGGAEKGAAIPVDPPAAMHPASEAGEQLSKGEPSASAAVIHGQNVPGLSRCVLVENRAHLDTADDFMDGEPADDPIGVLRDRVIAGAAEPPTDSAANTNGVSPSTYRLTAEDMEVYSQRHGQAAAVNQGDPPAETAPDQVQNDEQWKRLLQVWARYHRRIIPPLASEELHKYCDEFGYDWVIAALWKVGTDPYYTRKRGHVRYIGGILRNWEKEGYDGPTQSTIAADLGWGSYAGNDAGNDAGGDADWDNIPADPGPDCWGGQVPAHILSQLPDVREGDIDF